MDKHLHTLKKPQLVQICKDRHIKGYSTLNKSGLIDLICNQSNQGNQSNQTPEPLQIGESIDIPSDSTSEVYTVTRKQKGYECTCRGYTFCSGPKEHKTCKHIKHVKNIKNLKAGSVKKMETRSKKIQKTQNNNILGTGPQKLILAHNFDNQDVTHWYMSEKIDGIRAYWDGQQLWSRTGKEIHAPLFFTQDLPKGIPLDGELFMNESIALASTSNLFSKVCSITRKKIPVDEEWSNISFYVFDTVNHHLPFVDRYAIIKKLISKFCVILPQYIIRTRKEIDNFHADITSRGGEGVMLREPNSMYVGKRTKDLLKLKTFYDTEVKIINYKSGEGKYTGMLGAYECQMVNGNKITVGSGMNDADRRKPLPINTFITIKYFELTTKNKVPRFPVYLRKAERQEFSDGPIPGL